MLNQLARMAVPMNRLHRVAVINCTAGRRTSICNSSVGISSGARAVSKATLRVAVSSDKVGWASSSWLLIKQRTKKMVQARARLAPIFSQTCVYWLWEMPKFLSAHENWASRAAWVARVKEVSRPQSRAMQAKTGSGALK